MPQPPTKKGHHTMAGVVSAMESTKLAVYKLLSMTPEVFMELISRPDENEDDFDFDFDMQKSLAILAASRNPIIRTSTIPDPRIMVTNVKLGSILHGVTVNLPGGNMAKLLAESWVGLALRGQLGDKTEFYPLKQVSATRWISEDAIRLPENTPDLTISLVSDLWGEFGCTSLSGKSLIEARSRDMDRPNFVKREIASEYCGASNPIDILFVVWPMALNSEVECEPPLDHFFRTGEENDLNQLIVSLRKSLSTLPNSSPIHLTTRIFLSEAYLTRAQVFGRTQDHHDSVLAAEIALSSITSSDHPAFKEHLPWARRTLGAALSGRFNVSGDREDIDRGIKALKRAADEMANMEWEEPSVFQTESYALALGNLGASLFQRHRKFPDTGDLEQGIMACRQALQIIPEGNKHRPSLLCSLGTSLMRRGAFERGFEDPEEGIRTLREGLSILNQDHPDASVWSCNLGSVLRGQYCHSGDLKHLNEAISVLQPALKTALKTTTPTLVDILDQLSGCYIQHYEHTSETQSLHEAISLYEHALNATSSAENVHIITLKNAAHAYRYLFQESGNAKYLSTAIAIQRIVVDLTLGDFTLPVVLGQLGADYVKLFLHSRELVDIQSAMNALEQAIEHCSPSGPEYAWMLGNLGLALQARYTLTWNMSDINQAIASIQKCFDLLSEDDISRTQHHQALADALMVRFLALDDPVDVDRALTHYSLVASSDTATPLRRLQGAKDWATFALKYRGPVQSLEAFDTVVKIVTLAAGMEQTMRRRHELLSKYSKDILEAAVTALAAERVDKAVEWLEEGRGLVWSQLRSLRTPLNTVQSHNPDLAGRFQMVCRQLEKAASEPRFSSSNQRRKASLDQKIDVHEGASEHLRLSRERESLLDAIRTTVPGLNDFLRPLPCSSWIDSLPESGPVILVNVYEGRCDAIVLFKGRDRPLHIPLPDFSLGRAKELVETLKTSIVKHGLRMRGEESAASGERAIRPMVRAAPAVAPNRLSSTEIVLQQLWVGVVKPIITALAFKRSVAGTPTQRVWWCPTGPLTFLPLHAAGIFRGEDRVALSDYAVSSYIPTIRILAEQVKKPRPVPLNKSGILLVSVPNAPACSSIPGTTIEIQDIVQKVENFHIRSLRLEGEGAVIETGLKEMHNYSCIHLACHATQAAADPLHSAFHFYNGKLDLSTIIKSDLKWAEFAFLSACQTSTGTEELSEEAVHLAGGMLAAGYRSVVATMWSIQDEYAPKVADEFYQELFRLGSGDVDDGTSKKDLRIDGVHAAYALHHAVKQLQQRIGVDSERSFLAWVPYVHFGL